MGEADELSEIPGIGQARAQWLEQTFAVHGFDDLAALSPDEIERKLKAEGRVAISRKSIESWVAEARARASGKTERQGERPTQKGSGPANGRSEASEWKPEASFVVEFRSRTDPGAETSWRTGVHYVEKDEDETWAGIECEPLCRWMTEQLEPMGARRRMTSGEVEEPPAAADTRDERRGPWLAASLDAHMVDGDGNEGAGLIRIDKPWTVIFSWSLDDAGRPETRGEWRLDVLLNNVGRGEPLRLREGPVRLPAEGPRIDGGYRYRFEVPVGVVTTAHVDALYRATATIMYRPEDTDRVLHAGFVDLGLVRFYEPLQASLTGELPISTISSISAP